MLKDHRKRPLFIKDKEGNIYQSYYLKNGLHFCKDYHLILDTDVIKKSHLKENLL